MTPGVDLVIALVWHAVYTMSGLERLPRNPYELMLCWLNFSAVFLLVLTVDAVCTLVRWVVDVLVAGYAP